jgi:hypothetical protein
LYNVLRDELVEVIISKENVDSVVNLLVANKTRCTLMMDRDQVKSESLSIINDEKERFLSASAPLFV